MTTNEWATRASAPDRASLPELWGGFECTIARIGDLYRDQSVETGHRSRIEDLDAAAGLGIGTLRYPVLWESLAPDGPQGRDWSWHDARMVRMAELGIRPIVGLLHHGSGPPATSLLDPLFPGLLAEHAARVAERYPEVEAYTPVNEPLTTARFSALYGHWYPHQRDLGAFLRAVVLQCKATLLAMRAIRRVTPRARLVQTEDLGRTWSTPDLADQAGFDNERRWLSLDLLCGRVDERHPLFDLLQTSGIDLSDLALLREGDAIPDIVGINHYPTSERFLDSDLRPYWPHLHGGNGWQAFADVEALRVEPPLPDLGPRARLSEAWERYRLPIAVTEAHHGCTREEQMRWLAHVWEAACELRAGGADIRAVTVWSLAGAVDWDTLLVSRWGHYEPGAFDIRSPRPRPTALARMAGSLAREGRADHPVLDGPGWWGRADRFYGAGGRRTIRPPGEERPLLVLGRSGTLGRAFETVCERRGLAAVFVDRRTADLSDRRALAEQVRRHRPWAVVNAAGYVRVAQAEREPEACFRANAEGPALLAELCAAERLPLLAFSSDRVFDGRLGRAYRESDEPRPVDVYGASKAEMERRVAGVHPAALIVRTSAFFGPWDEANFALGVLRDLASRRPVAADAAATVSPTYVPDLVHASLDLLIDGESGLWHLANAGQTSWADFGRALAATFDLPWREAPSAAQSRPANTALVSERGWIMPSLEGAMARFRREIRPDWRPAAALAAE